MILYTVLRAITGIALRWFYRDVSVRHAERIPRDTPLLLTVNHPNALVDALVVGWALPRRLTITAKATLFGNPVLGWFLHIAGVIPLRRATDEREHRAEIGNTGGTSSAAKPGYVNEARNSEAFRAILERLESRGAVLIFPEGKSHDEPALAPLRTGPARIALQAQDEGRIKGLAILPIGLVFEQKEAPRSRVLVDIGEPLYTDRWIATADDTARVKALTEEIDRRLHEVTLNYATADEAALTRGLAKVFASLLDNPLSIGRDRPLEAEVELERQLAQARHVLESEVSEPAVHTRAEQLLERLAAFERTLCAERIALDEVAIPLGSHHGIRFAIRESLVLAMLGPVALWGRVNHWLPFRLARNLGERDITSRDQPAMRTILAGLSFVLLFYGLAAAMMMYVAGGVAAALYLVSLPFAADIDLRFTKRMRQARQRMHAFIRFRRKPELHRQLSTEHRWLVHEIGELAQLLESPKRITG